MKGKKAENAPEKTKTKIEHPVRKAFLRFFIISFVFSFCLVLLLLGIVAVQYNTRLITDEKASMRVDLYIGKEGKLEGNFLKKEYQWQLPMISNKSERWEDFVPLPARLLGFALEGSEKLLEKVFDVFL